MLNRLLSWLGFAGSSRFQIETFQVGRFTLHGGRRE